MSGPYMDSSLDLFRIVWLLALTTALTSGVRGHLEHVRSRTAAAVQEQAVRDLIGRLLPTRAASFQVVVDGDDGPSAYFELEANGTAVLVRASSGVTAAWGVHHYLEQFCHCHVSWDADQLELPDPLPSVDRLRVVSLDRFRYYQNVCTVGYSSVWWAWPRWEREIDWMALHGINLPLALTGQEAIWRRVYLELGLTPAEIDQHFTGPAFLPWQRMGNVRGWAGPLTDDWHERTLSLQHRILERMRQLGMVPVLPAFAGHVPRAAERLFPDANLTRLGSWNRFQDEYCCATFVEPSDRLFADIGGRFLRHLTAEFGTDHVYNCDVFNEMSPPQDRPEYIGAVGRAVYDAMTAVDADAVWLMQAWMFLSEAPFWNRERSRALLTSVPTGRMLVLDLQAESKPQYRRLDSFFGQPFIFCLLHNFGGTLGMYGTVASLAQAVLDGRKAADSTMMGTGLAMEGINQNYVVYDLMLQMGWRSQAPDLAVWFDDYARRRYGPTETRSMSTTSSWRFLRRSVYNASSELFFRGRYLTLGRRPSLSFKPAPPPLWYNPDDVILAWDNLCDASFDAAVSSRATFRHDLVDLSRQSFQEMFQLFYSLLVTAYGEGNAAATADAAEKMTELLRDLDALLATGDNFLLGRWLADAGRWADADADGGAQRRRLQWSAKNQITLWGPNGEIADYATKQWAGVVVDFQLPRWQLFVDRLQESLSSGLGFNQTAFDDEVFRTVEQPFTVDTKTYRETATGDVVDTVRRLYDKWRPLYTEYRHSIGPKAFDFWRRGGQRRRRRPGHRRQHERRSRQRS